MNKLSTIDIIIYQVTIITFPLIIGWLFWGWKIALAIFLIGSIVVAIVKINSED